jgi:hypothetical protein
VNVTTLRELAAWVGLAAVTCLLGAHAAVYGRDRMRRQGDTYHGSPKAWIAYLGGLTLALLSLAVILSATAKAVITWTT